MLLPNEKMRYCLLSLFLSSSVTAIPTAPKSSMTKRDSSTSPNLAVLGDSWGSGVAYRRSNEYDNNKDYCLRWNQAYGAQLGNDKGWAASKTNSMQFVACSGSRLVDIVQGQQQINKLTGELDAIILTIGGNNVGFFAVADSCLYHSSRIDYGPQYPDQKGKCKQAIDDAENYIRNTLKTDLENTYADILKSKIVENNENVKIYQTGYARFFSTAGKGTKDDWCEAKKGSFNTWVGLGQGTRSYLTNDVRTKINDLVVEVNTVIEFVTREEKFKNHFNYQDIDNDFEGHRFCEVGSSMWNQYMSPKVWLWNLIAPGLGAVNVDDLKLPDDFHTNPDYDFGNAANVTKTDVENGIDNIMGLSSGGNDIIWGWKLRPFHPKAPAYSSIKDGIVVRLKGDKLQGAVL